MSYPYIVSFSSECPNCNSEQHFYCYSLIKTMFLETKKSKLPQVHRLRCGLILTMKIEGEEKPVEEVKYRKEFTCEKEECLINGI